VIFREGDSRIRTGYAPENLNIVCQLAINLLKDRALENEFKEKAV